MHTRNNTREMTALSLVPMGTKMMLYILNALFFPPKQIHVASGSLLLRDAFRDGARFDGFGVRRDACSLVVFIVFRSNVIHAALHTRRMIGMYYCVPFGAW